MADSPSGSRPLLRVGGIALLGVGVIAATIGLFTSATQGNGTGTAVPSASSQALPPSGEATATEPVPAAPPSAVAPDTALPAPTAPAAPNPSAEAPPAAQPPVAQPPAAAPAPGGGGGAGGSGAGGDNARAPLRVFNNSLVEGLAAKAKSDFESRGWTVTDISGYSEGNIAHSTVYFRPGTSEEAAAQELGREFGLRVEPRFPGIEQASAGVIVILTEDYAATGKS